MNIIFCVEQPIFLYRFMLSDSWCRPSFNNILQLLTPTPSNAFHALLQHLTSTSFVQYYIFTHLGSHNIQIFTTMAGRLFTQESEAQ
jgi:hypothetical protein